MAETMVPEMVERVARGLFVRAFGDGPPTWDEATTLHRQLYIDDARAAIAAMREPTDAIATEEDMKDVWRGMVDAALNT